ncbi:MAG TPA: O-antigen ligase family protein [Verrucomicrobiae bacterium]
MIWGNSRQVDSAASLRAADVQLYRAGDLLSGAIICLLVVFSPWAFGTTERWSMWVMNCGGYALGALLLVKLTIRRFRGYRPSRWISEGTAPLTYALAALTGLLLAYCLVSALNARATFDERSLTFAYRDCIRWLPHSLDASATWFAFWTYLGLACCFWAVRDWLLGKSSGEERAEWQKLSSVNGAAAPLFPARLRRFLWLLAISGALLGAEAVIQRAANSPRLLFLVQPRIHQTAEGQFGPYAYRSNAAQYFNLLWPVCLGFWWTLNRGCGPRRTNHHLVLVAAAIMAACPILSTSRAGAIISAALAGLAALVFAATHWLAEPVRPRSSLSSARREARRARRLTFRALAVFFIAALALGFALGWKQLRPRLDEFSDGLAGREQLYAAARPIARDYPVFGIGPGSFETVSQLYPRPDIFWPAQLHNDWLETRITFGWAGSCLIAAAFICVLLRWFSPGGIHGGRRFVILCWLALGGCMLHARFDFPFQIHSTLFLFLLICAILFTLSRRPVAQ